MKRAPATSGRAPAHAPLGPAWFVGLAAALGAAALLALQLVIAPPWQASLPPPETFPVLHGPTPSELFAALTGQEHEAMAGEIKALRALLDAGADTEAALPTVRARLAKLQADEEHKLQQDTTPALALAAVVGRIDGAISAIQHAASRVNANPPPATVAPLSLGVAGLGLLASALGLLGGALGRPRAAVADPSGNAETPLRALLDEGWSELARQREAGAKAANDQAVLGARLTGAVLDAEGRLAAGTATAIRDDEASRTEGDAINRLELLAERLGDAVVALPSLAAMLAETAETLRQSEPVSGGPAIDARRLEALCERLEAEGARLTDTLTRDGGDRDAWRVAIEEAVGTLRAAADGVTAAGAARLDATAASLDASLAALPAQVSALADAWRGETETAARRIGNEAVALVANGAKEALLPLPVAVSRLEVAANAIAAAREGGEAADPAWLGRLEARLDQAVLAATEAERALPRSTLADQAEAVQAAMAVALTDTLARIDRAIEAGLAAHLLATPGAAGVHTFRNPGGAGSAEARDQALEAAASRLIAAGESQAERLESMLRDIVSVAGSLPPVGNGLAETAVSLGMAAREQGEVVAEAGRRLDEALRSLETLAGAGASSVRAAAAADEALLYVASTDRSSLDEAGSARSAAAWPDAAALGLDDPTVLGRVLRELPAAEVLAASLAEAAASLRASPAGLPAAWANATPGLLTRLDVTIQRLRYAATALALAGDDALAREAA